MTSRSTAQQRADDIRAFRTELERLRTEGALVLSDEQRADLERHHEQLLAEFARSFDIDRDAHARQLSVGMRIASFLGALALAAAVFFLFRNFWGLLAEPAQVAVLIGSSLGSCLLTMWVRKRDPTGHFTRLCATVAFACFVLNVAMLGEVFNAAPSDNVLLAWAALGLLLAYLCDSRLLLAAGILCLMGYLSARAGAWRGAFSRDARRVRRTLPGTKSTKPAGCSLSTRDSSATPCGPGIRTGNVSRSYAASSGPWSPPSASPSRRSAGSASVR